MRGRLRFALALAIALAAPAGCRCDVSADSGPGLPIAKRGPEKWQIDGSPHEIAGTYYLPMADGIQFTVEYEVPPGTVLSNIRDEDAYDLAFPVMKHVFENRIHERIAVSELGGGERMVSRIGVELFVTVGDGRSGYRVARPLSEVGDRISAEASVPR